MVVRECVRGETLYSMFDLSVDSAGLFERGVPIAQEKALSVAAHISPWVRPITHLYLS